MNAANSEQNTGKIMKEIIIPENSQQILDIEENEVKIVAKKNSKAHILIKAENIITETEENANIILFTLSSAKVHAKLIGDNSNQRTINLFKANNEEITIDTTSEHTGKNTNSRIETKGTLTKSTATTRGMVKINPQADDADGYQKSDLLILDDSKAISVPDLEIHNHNVTCSHGSTITKLDENQIFYMQSRGLKKEDAEQEIINGFFTAMLKDIPEELTKKIKQKLEIK